MVTIKILFTIPVDFKKHLIELRKSRPEIMNTAVDQLQRE